MRNSYDGEFVDMKKVEDEAYKRAERGETTKIHYHTIEQECSGKDFKYEHKLVEPERPDDN